MSANSCFHCGDDIIGKGIDFDEKSFCCNGCKSVYELLSSNELGSFYSIEEQAGRRPSQSNEHKYAFLEVEAIRRKYIDFEDDNSIHVTLFLPQIHCSSCIYLLENIQKIEENVLSCQVNFTKREASISLKQGTSLADFALLLDKIGYAPNFGNRQETAKKKNKTLLYKLGIAGFAFGSIMLWSFPEYLGIEKDNPEFRSFTSWLSFGVSIPVILYSAQEYFISAFKAIRYKSLNLDVPISIGILALYLQSAYNIFAGIGPGYMDSFAGFIFFLLIGKWFQNKTYESLSFERDYTSYFPVAVTKLDKDEEEIVEINDIAVDDILLIRNQEVIPCDSILLSDEAKIDYSFVTGEADPVTKHKGDLIYAGGKLLGKQSRFVVQKESSRSHLTQLWNESDTKSKKKASTTDKISSYFLAGVLIIAGISGILWYFLDSSRITEIVVSVLIVACPCALALSAPFTYGNIMRLLGRKGLYLKNTAVIEDINDVTDVVFDKTGTLTTGSSDHVNYSGQDLSAEELQAIALLANSSTHPLSRTLVKHLRPQLAPIQSELEEFEEISGAGIIGKTEDFRVKLGSASFLNSTNGSEETAIHVAINDRYKGVFSFESSFRDGIVDFLETLGKGKNIHVLSGDSSRDESFFNDNTPWIEHIYFKQSPKDKLHYITDLQENDKRVMMIGDGLNDSGALQQSDVGIAISEDIFRFTPSSDAIIEATRLTRLSKLLDVSQFSRTILIICYLFSLIYNVVGLTFAITGNLTPLIAAILMPLSSISIVFISTFLARIKR